MSKVTYAKIIGFINPFIHSSSESFMTCNGWAYAFNEFLIPYGEHKTDFIQNSAVWPHFFCNKYTCV